jgi:hypothetical protein
MRKLPILLVLLLASLMLLAAAASAHAIGLPATAEGSPFVVEVDEEDEADDGEADDEGDEEAGNEIDDFEGADEGEDCEGDDDELCEEDLELEEAEECVLEDASASFTAAPGAGQVRLTVHYRAFEPTPVLVDARLRGSKGALHLGSDRARFRRAGVFHYSFDLGSKQMAKAVAAKDFEVDLYAVGTPADCELHLATRGPRRAK